MLKTISKQSQTVSASTIIDRTSPAIPWQPRPAGSTDVVWRHDKNPIIGRRPIPCAQGVYNSAVVRYKTGYVGIFRVDHKNRMPRLHFGYAHDGLAWTIEPEPIVLTGAASDVRKMEYAYDPRLCQIEDDWYITWCNGYHGPTIGMARTKDFVAYEQLENAFLPFNRNGVLFPRRINGNYAMLNRPSDNGHTRFGDIFYSESPDMTFWGKHRHVMAAGGQWWQGVKIGAGPIPIETKEGWLMFYHGVLSTCNGFIYSMGAALLDIHQPWKVLYRTHEPLLAPEMSYETAGNVANVIFPCACLYDEDSGKIAIYYGAADTCTCLAYADRDELITFIKNHSEV